MTYKCEIDLSSAIDWQRGSAEKLNKLIELKQAWYDKNHCDFWNDWVEDVFDNGNGGTYFSYLNASLTYEVYSNFNSMNV